MKTRKIVLSKSGGFWLSEEAIEMIGKKKKEKGDFSQEPFDQHYQNISRWDRDLVSTVEELGAKAGLKEMKVELVICKVSLGKPFVINYEEATEDIQYRDDIEWITL